jgi:hypothetical protein
MTRADDADGGPARQATACATREAGLRPCCVRLLVMGDSYEACWKSGVASALYALFMTVLFCTHAMQHGSGSRQDTAPAAQGTYCSHFLFGSQLALRLH